MWHVLAWLRKSYKNCITVVTHCSECNLGSWSYTIIARCLSNSCYIGSNFPIPDITFDRVLKSITENLKKHTGTRKYVPGKYRTLYLQSRKTFFYSYLHSLFCRYLKRKELPLPWRRHWLVWMGWAKLEYLNLYALQISFFPKGIATTSFQLETRTIQSKQADMDICMNLKN